ncbi:MAG: ABC transporter ATP-binding protein, partial [Acetobacteraceae bacterium]|nr:ABC transporter ATP-binding protein [Acetobacteraceae bacterium]
MIALHGVTKRFGATEIIRGIDLHVEAGERHAIIGPNGAGKSTTFHLISGRIRPTSGAITLRGEPIAGLPPHVIARRGLSRSFQVTNIFPRLSVWENLRCAVLWSAGQRYCFWRGVGARPQVQTRTAALIEQIGLAHRWDVPAGLLAYAEQRALEIGITIAGEPSVILLDEPTAGMSRTETEAAVALIRRVSERRTLVMVEHDMAV